MEEKEKKTNENMRDNRISINFATSEIVIGSTDLNMSEIVAVLDALIQKYFNNCNNKSRNYAG